MHSNHQVKLRGRCVSGMLAPLTPPTLRTTGPRIFFVPSNELLRMAYNLTFGDIYLGTYLKSQLNTNTADLARFAHSLTSTVNCPGSNIRLLCFTLLGGQLRNYIVKYIHHFSLS